MNSIFNRRSIRRYSDKKVELYKIDMLLKAAMCAPSAGNEQPWEFIVIKKRKMLEKISNLLPFGKMIKNADTAILICGNESKQKYDKNYWIMDCSAAAENILIEAVELDLGAVWLAIYPELDRIDNIRKLFEIPESVIPFCVIPLGYKGEEKPIVNRYNKEAIHLEMWMEDRYE